MAIKPLPQSVPTDLPPAKLYLDDIREICDILKDSTGDWSVRFVVGNRRCDTLDDLLELGGRTKKFAIDITAPNKSRNLDITPYSSRINVYDYGEGRSDEWSIYAKVAAVFENRKLKLKAASRAVEGWIFFGLAAVLFWVGMLRPFSRPINVHDAPVLIGTTLLALVVGYYFVESHSVVYLRYSHEAGARRWFDEHLSQIIMLIIGAVVGAVMSRIADKLLK